MNNALKNLYSICLVGMMALLPKPLFAQKELKNTDRARYADVGYTKLGFGEVNRKLLTERQAQKLDRRIEGIQSEHGVVVVLVSLVAEEVIDWEKGLNHGLPRHFWGEDPHVARHHITLLFDENSGRNWILYGSDNTPDLAAHTLSLSGLFASAYRNRKAYRPIRRLLRRIDRVYSGLSAQRRSALLRPRLSASEWVALAGAEMNIARDYGSAVRNLEKALALDSVNAEAYMRLGYAQIELGNWKAAADALERSWLLHVGFETAVGNLTLYSLLRDTAATDKWAGRIRKFDGEFKERIRRMAQYKNGRFFIGNVAHNVFSEVFQREIQQSGSEEVPEMRAQ